MSTQKPVLILKKKTDNNVRPVLAKRQVRTNIKHSINDMIVSKTNQVRLIGENGSEVVDLDEALQRAQEEDTDLVQVTEADMPICRLVNYDKFLYQLEKKSKANKQEVKKQKQIKFHPNIGPNDLSHKVRHIREFIEDNHRVEVVCTFQGRENKFKGFGFELFEKILGELTDVAKLDGSIKENGRAIQMYLMKK